MFGILCAKNKETKIWSYPVDSISEDYFICKKINVYSYLII